MVKIQKEEKLLEPKDFKPSCKELKVIGVLNPAAVRMKNGKIFMYVRVIERLIKTENSKYCFSPRMVGKKSFKMTIDKFNKKEIKHKSNLDFVFKDGTLRLTFISHFRKVILDREGFNVLEIDEKPSFHGTKEDGGLGVEDPRISKIGDRYIMTYVTLSENQNISTSIAFSNDLKNWDRKGIIFGEQDKDVVIFPEKINGKYVAFDRPEGNFHFSPPHIWIAYSNDLLCWGNLKSINLYKRGDKGYSRNGAGPPPIKTKAGWLLLYHTVIKKKITKKQRKSLGVALRLFKLERRDVETTYSYSVGAALFSLNDPSKLIAKSKDLIIHPEKDYDISQFENKKVVFPTGMVLDENKKDLLIYSGSGDFITTVKKISLNEICKSLKKKTCKAG